MELRTGLILLLAMAVTVQKSIRVQAGVLGKGDRNAHP